MSVAAPSILPKQVQGAAYSAMHKLPVRGRRQLGRCHGGGAAAATAHCCTRLPGAVPKQHPRKHQQRTKSVQSDGTQKYALYV